MIASRLQASFLQKALAKAIVVAIELFYAGYDTCFSNHFAEIFQQ